VRGALNLHSSALSPAMSGLREPSQNTIMNTQILSKLAALAVALMMNGLFIAGVNFLLNVQLHQHTAEMALAQANGVPSRLQPDG
jgi:hypothetical protein